MNHDRYIGDQVIAVSGAQSTHNYFSYSISRGYLNSIEFLAKKVGVAAACKIEYVGILVFSFACGAGIGIYYGYIVFKVLAIPALSAGTAFAAYFFSAFIISIELPSVLNAMREKDIKKLQIESQKNNKHLLVLDGVLRKKSSKKRSLTDDILIHKRMLLRQFCKSHAFQIIKMNKEKQAFESIKKIKDCSIDTLLIESHGNRFEFAFSDSLILSAETLESLEAILRKLKAKSRMILASCEVGKGNLNIALLLSLLKPGNTVFSPRSSIHLVQGVSLDAQLTPQFWTSHGKSAPMAIYRRGKQI